MADRREDARKAAVGFVDLLVALDERLDDYLVVRTYDEGRGWLSSSFEGRLDGIRVKPAANELRLYFDLGLGKTRLRLGRLTAFRVRHVPTDAEALEFCHGGRRLIEVGPRGWSEVACG
jgi:hypothetical protein